MLKVILENNHIKIKSLIITLGINTTQYEAFLTDKKEFMENTLIPKIVLVLQLFSATVMLITTIVLKILFSSVKKTSGPKKNTISFKSLNILFIVWMFVTAIPFGFKDVVLIPFAVSVAENTMLISILILNEESLEYVKSLVMKLTHTRNEEEKIDITRLGLQCRTPLRSYPLTLILNPTPCPLSPSTAPSQKI